MMAQAIVDGDRVNSLIPLESTTIKKRERFRVKWTFVPRFVAEDLTLAGRRQSGTCRTAADQ
jgi:hypothetical protein